MWGGWGVCQRKTLLVNEVAGHMVLCHVLSTPPQGTDIPICRESRSPGCSITQPPQTICHGLWEGLEGRGQHVGAHPEDTEIQGQMNHSADYGTVRRTTTPACLLKRQEPSGIW